MMLLNPYVFVESTGGEVGECAPYTYPIPTAVITDLDSFIVYPTETAVETNLCSEII